MLVKGATVYQTNNAEYINISSRLSCVHAAKIDSST